MKLPRAPVRRFFGVALVLGLSIAAAALPLWASRPAPSGPRLGLPEYPLDLGTGKPHAIVDGFFELRNIGAAPLDYRIAASCGCSDVSPRAGRIAPGELVTVHVGIRLEAQGTEKDVRLTIQSNDTARPEAVYGVHAACPAPFEVRPAAADFGSVPQGSTRELSVAVRDNERPDGGIAHLVFEPSVPWLSARPTADGVLVTLGKDAPAGYLCAEVVIRSTSDQRRYSIPVAAHVRGEVVVAPASLFLQRDGAGEPPRFLVWRPDGRPLGRVQEMQVPAGLKVEERSKPDDKRRVFEVVRTADGGMEAGAAISLRFEHGATPIQVSVHAP